jgi:glycosyltransferase involved in cell wall biosynthesis
LRILFLSHYFPPEVNAPANRTFEHCREWAAAGQEVHVVTGVPSHPAGIPFPGHKRGWYRHEQIDGVHVHRVWTYLAPNRGVARRTLNYLSFVPTAVFRVWRLGRFDVMISTSPQFFCAVAGRFAAALRRTPWIFELRDLWPESIHAVGALRRSLALRMLERLELSLYARANAVVCVAQGFIANLERRGVDGRKLRYVPNGIEPEFWAAGSRESGRARLGLMPNQIAVIYTGTIGMAHGLGTVLQAARLVETSLPHVRFFIVGDGAELAELKSRAAESRQLNIAFTGQLPRQHIADILAASDVTLVMLKPAETFKSVLPSKMFEAMAAGKPIVLAVEGEARQVLERSQAGVPVPPGDAVALARAVAKLAQKPELRERLGAAGSAVVATEFNRAVWAERYLDILVEAARKEVPVSVRLTTSAKATVVRRSFSEGGSRTPRTET